MTAVKVFIVLVLKVVEAQVVSAAVIIETAGH
jgi:hypothetical protein